MDGRLIYLMGPSGSGKDSLIEAAREPLRAMNCEIIRRVITRSAESVGEDAVGVTPQEFEQRQRDGDFALAWHANGLAYGIPIEMDEWLRAGRHVLVNGSRANLRDALTHYPTLIPVLLTVKDEVLRERLVRRGRETFEQIDARLARNALFKDRRTSDLPVHLIDNSGALVDAVNQLLDLIRLNATPDRT
ncbi:phosphonate metabolism protein/1,5-bisphosphokinase (PRPP-forming) PhnN [Pseudomonas sp. HMWF006]|uniref:phosphonate metabolism protein/1,5-bisphosphokinase (PRPP-forming) PhnN n=1 Tax=Pseudomonas sp. HMWF006 TaxID=2056843 RepID=UPI000D410229|nr:phosphonate metabolism protein/1,5-bisphosphokinase (PRPP-forming) PhnN [Pseudomonas sp. HMWF006]PTS93483.1 phosphonate metabolism protein/1,5-bisphosphokinase (PRPP-forming) PhnN [Pseudomonas sp. HMWF006]PTT68261.1 phosphonate metabolism protein/1,5-bisphosphokinase (PRPP-forming) PhnN [Pseudomonas sp. HMWF007]PTT80037.1 phosphonate metabolism protein/1,5-bisphosphokinase (PRPP-forming) PhnN [Pseudomonas sp. HMWF005]